jgi:hypothetical protein
VLALERTVSLRLIARGQRTQAQGDRIRCTDTVLELKAGLLHNRWHEHLEQVGGASRGPAQERADDYGIL